MKQMKSYVELHDRLDSYVNGLPLSEQEELRKGQKDVRFRLVSISTTSSSRQVSVIVLPDASNIVAHLKQFSSREEGYDYLRSLHLNRNGYQQLLRLMDMPYTSRDNTQVMQAKLIEGAIGYRLRTQAILEA